jgi:hypothetical protein
MFPYKIHNPQFHIDDEGDVAFCSFFVKEKKYWFPPDGYLKPTFLVNGCVPLGTKGEIDPILLARGVELKPDFKELENLSTDPRLVKLGFIFFLESYYNRIKASGPVIDRINIRELAEFWILRKGYGIDYRSWIEFLRKFIVGVKISD